MRQDIEERINATKVPYKIYAEFVEDKAAEQFANCLEQESVVQGALMPDTHAGYVAPIGSVLATNGTIFPSFVGYDIGCGMSSIRTNIQYKSVSTEQLEAIKNQILRDIPIGFERHSKPQTHIVDRFTMTPFAKDVLHTTGSYQLGTLGGGNHFLEIGYDNDEYLNIVVHSGSRGVGHKIATKYMKEAAIQSVDESRYRKEFDEKNKAWLNKILNSKSSPANDKLQDRYDKAKTEFTYRRTRARVSNIEDAYPLDVTSEPGMGYIQDMNMALEFALENRELMIGRSVAAIAKVLGQDISTSRFINRNHNHAELVDGRWIHRKGATQAADGMIGVIPGNMVDGSFIVRGRGSSDSMNSSSHGAGRVLSRRKAKDTLDLEEFISSTAHLIANHSDSNLDESPLAYKNIFDVMEQQSDLVKTLDRIVPIINIKG